MKKHIQTSHPIEYESKIKTNLGKISNLLSLCIVDLNDCKEYVELSQQMVFEDEEEVKSEDGSSHSSGSKV